MTVLLTNDDGIESPGLDALAEALSGAHEVWIVAPDRERSGSSHSITLRGSVQFRKLAERRFSCGGTPADCVLYSCLGALPVKPDLILAGINLGPNLGTDVVYSGTAAAARQGALMGYPSAALSVAGSRGPLYFDAAASFAERNAETIVALWKPDHFLNVNVPNRPERSLAAVVTHPSRRIYRDTIASFTAPSRDVYYFLESVPSDAARDEGSDWEAVSRGDISISPIFLHPISHDDVVAYERADFRT